MTENKGFTEAYYSNYGGKWSTEWYELSKEDAINWMEMIVKKFHRPYAKLYQIVNNEEVVIGVWVNGIRQ